MILTYPFNLEKRVRAVKSEGEEERRVIVEKFASQAPDPVIKVGIDGRLIYSNRAGQFLMQAWDIKIGAEVPAFIKHTVRKALFLNYSEKTEIKVRRRTYLATFQPVSEKEEVIINWFDITGQKKLQKKVRIKERQHDTLRKLSALAFRYKNLQGFMDKTVKLVTETLALDYSRILELQPDGNFLLKAGQGWKADAVGKAIIDGSKNSQAGYTLFSKTPVIVTDFKKEIRFEPSVFLKEHNIVSGISVIIGKAQIPYGILSAHSRNPRKYTADDIYFMNAVAFIVSEVIERKNVEEELRLYKEQLEELIEERTSALTKINQQLSLEIAEREKIGIDLKNNVFFLETLLDAIPSPVFYRNLQGIYQGCNKFLPNISLGFPKRK